MDQTYKQAEQTYKQTLENKLENDPKDQSPTNKQSNKIILFAHLRHFMLKTWKPISIILCPTNYMMESLWV